MTEHHLDPDHLATLAEVRDNIAGLPNAADINELGRSVADGLRIEYPDLSDGLLAHLVGNVTAYAYKFSHENPEAAVIELAVVFAAAAINLATLDLPGVTQP